MEQLGAGKPDNDSRQQNTSTPPTGKTVERATMSLCTRHLDNGESGAEKGVTFHAHGHWVLSAQRGKLDEQSIGDSKPINLLASTRALRFPLARGHGVIKTRWKATLYRL